MHQLENIKLKHLVIAGLVAETVFEFYAWLISPIIFEKTLVPAKLLIGLSQKFAGFALPYEFAFVIHFLIGSLGFPLFVYVAQKVLRTPLLITGLISGIALWFIAQGVLAPLMGRAFMMGFGAYTQSSFIGHVGMALIIALIFKYFQSSESSA